MPGGFCMVAIPAKQQLGRPRFAGRCFGAENGPWRMSASSRSSPDSPEPRISLPLREGGIGPPEDQGPEVCLDTIGRRIKEELK